MFIKRSLSHSKTVVTVVMTLENSITMTQSTLWNSKAMPYFRETSISFVLICAYNKLNQLNEEDLDFSDGYGRNYNLSEVGFKTLMTYIEMDIANGFIQQPSSPMAALIQLLKKQDGGLQLCADYSLLIRETLKNRYPLPQISEMIGRLHQASILIKLDLQNAYHLI
jgi:hypothetical protein